jgi:hypothetical protein
LFRSKQSRDSSIFSKGFVYVGQDLSVESHDLCGIETPSVLSVDHDYIFHHSIPLDDAEFARTALPQRLQQLGFLLTKPVDSGEGFVAIGPTHLWSVQFTRRGCSGSIGNVVCRTLTGKRLFKSSRWEPSDYILSLHGNCSQ